jgi:hypothetical protein
LEPLTAAADFAFGAEPTFDPAARRLELDLLGESKCVIDLDTEIAHSGLDFGVAQQ